MDALFRDLGFNYLDRRDLVQIKPEELPPPVDQPIDALRETESDDRYGRATRDTAPSQNGLTNGSKVEVWFDGGSRSNPNGQAVPAAIVRDPVEGVTLRHVGRALGIASNNVAEWRPLLIALETARELFATEVRAFGDLQLVVEQFFGNFQVNSEASRPLCAEARRLATCFPGGVKAKHVPRAQNHAADAICNAVLDGAYVGDGTSLVGDTADKTKPVCVAFFVEVTMNAKEARDALSAGTTEAALRKTLAGRAERKLLLSGSVGGDTFRAARVKG